MTLSRIIIYGHLLDKLKSFYVDNFGLSVLEEIKGEWLLLNAGPIEIGFVRIGKEYEPKDGKEFKAESNTKLVFHIQDDLTAFRKRFVDKGIRINKILRTDELGALRRGRQETSFRSNKGELGNSIAKAGRRCARNRCTRA